MNYFTWISQEAFDNWHQTVVEGLNLPRIGVNSATGELAPDKQHTTAYTSVLEVSADDWRAPVESDIAAAYSDGLGAPCDPPPSLDLYE